MKLVDDATVSERVAGVVPRTGRKRGNNEGNISRRSDSRWQARITLENGGRKYFYARTRQEAAKLLAQAMRDRDTGIPIVGEKLTVAQYLKQWLDDIAPSLKPRSLQRYEEDVRLRLIPALGKTPLARLSAQQVQAVYSATLKRGLAQGTVAHTHAVLRRALGEAQRLGLVQRNAATLVKAPRPGRHEMHTLAPDEVRRLFEVAAEDRLEALYVLAVTTGMRRGELLGLHWADVDLDGGYVQVHYTLQHLKDGAYTFAPPKTLRSRRKVALTTVAIAALRRHRQRQDEERAAIGAEWREEDMVFTNGTGGPLRANHILQRRFTPLLRKAGLPLIRFHDLRHTAATLLLRQGVHPKIVAEMLGHSTISMTLDIYSHVIPDMQKDATVALDRLLEDHTKERESHRQPRNMIDV
jgi:integrase